jgi:Zn-dependent protease with chaperone function
MAGDVDNPKVGASTINGRQQVLHPPRPRGLSRLISPLCTLALLAVFALYFGLLIAAVFELFREVDRLLSAPWQGWAVALQVLLICILAMLAVRIARRLSLSILGLVTHRHDQWERERTVPIGGDEPFQAIVRQVCERLGARLPDEVRLSADDECFVIEEREFALQTNRRVVLVLGLPHLLVMTAGEVQVILAHELAHFRSGDTTLTVFLFRLAESARIAMEDLRRGRWFFADPVYWYFAVFYRLFQWVSAPWQRNHELQADEVSAAAFGGELAAQTLLKEWLVQLRFESALDDFDANDGDASVYDDYLRQWDDYTPESHRYLEKRLVESERSSLFSPQPRISQRLRHMRSYPDRVPVDTRAVVELLSEAQLRQAQTVLSQVPRRAD